MPMPEETTNTAPTTLSTMQAASQSTFTLLSMHNYNPHVISGNDKNKQLKLSRDLAQWLERLTANALVATVLGSIPASVGTVESEGRQMKQC